MSTRSAAVSRPKLDRTVVVDAALHVADTEGLEAVTIRRLAQELSVTAMALYWHFEDKESLLAAVADRMWAETAVLLDRSMEDLEASGQDDGGWAQLRVTVDALVTVMRRHPAVAALAPSRVVECDPGLSVTERTLGYLAERGFAPARAAELARFALCSAIMLVTSQPGVGISEPGARTELQRQKRLALASLPPDRYPHVISAAEYLTDCDETDAYFGRCIELVVAGVRYEAEAAKAT